MTIANKRLRKVGLASTRVIFYISIYFILISFGVTIGDLVTSNGNRDYSGIWLLLFPVFWVIVSRKILGKQRWSSNLGNALLIISAFISIPIVFILFFPSAYFLLPTIVPPFLLSLVLALYLRSSNKKKFKKKYSLRNKNKKKKPTVDNNEDVINLHDQMTRGLKFYMVKAALQQYQETLSMILLLQGDYAKNLLSPFSKRILSFSFLFLFYGVLLSFVVIIPVINYHQLIVNKWLYLLYNLHYAFIIGILFHFSFRLLGGKGTITQTMTCMNILSGALLPIQTFLLLPSLLTTKLDTQLFVKGPFYNFFEAMPEWISISILLLLFLFYILSYYAISLFTAWVSYFHNIDRTKIFVGWILASPLIFIYLIFIYPIIGNILYSISFKFLNMF